MVARRRWLAFDELAGIASWRPPRVSMWGLGGLWVVALVGAISAPTGDVVIAALIATTTWALGESARSRRMRRDEQDLRVAAEERVRIGREMHDIIAHNVSVIVVQAAAGAAVFDGTGRVRGRLDGRPVDVRFAM